MVDLKNGFNVTNVSKKSVLTHRVHCGEVHRRRSQMKNININHIRYTRFGLKNHNYYYYRPRCRPLYLITMLVLLVICVGVIVAYFVGAFDNTKQKVSDIPDPTKPLPPSASKLHRFKKAAVCVDSVACAEIGKNILKQNGSAVDAAIASLFCNGIINMHSMGLGGGFLMTIYTREDKTAYTLNAREVAPLLSTQDMFQTSKESQYSGKAIGVPGELRGYWTAHKRFGKLPWKDLVQPSIDLCERGYNMSFSQADVVRKIRNDTNLRSWFINEDGTNKRAGSHIVPKKLCETLKIIADTDGDELYNGTLSKILLQDIKDLGGIITKEDLENYRAEWDEPVSIKLNNGDHVYSVKPPGSGVLLAFILNILDGYNFTRDSINDIDNTVLTYHRIIEAYKFAYARRTELGDTAFVNISTLLKDLTSDEYAEMIRMKINDNKTYNNASYYGGVFYNKEDHGTAHMSVLAANGDAVSVTSTVNLYFGLGLTSKNTGIILNNGMDDFSSPNIINYFELPGSPNNAIAPGKRPLSSMTPTITTDKDGNVKFVIGSSGGTKITTAIGLVMMRNMWFGQNIKEAVDAPRIHHQLFPMQISYEYGNLQQVISGLKEKGHNASRYSDTGSVVCAILVQNGSIIANADFRKGGDVYGLN
ncbi:hypothetical protein FQA39_LY03040 [Lamprigera yunnana]|nr:hypothetical protein FQA39_LY03040 [Lamprigera yunnana]